ncbi:unnamed protein product [Closterium sp. Naga37s-1]|nr:unnamed protein product [Closterium sp. Naga37s-1]
MAPAEGEGNCVGYAARDASGVLSPWRFHRREVGPGDVKIRITHCGVCHSDVHLARNEWGNSMYPIVPGHEIIGVVEEVGAEAAAGSLDVVIDTVSAQHELGPYLDLLTFNGKLLLLGIPPAPFTLHASQLVFGRKMVAGSLIGGIKETQEMLEFCAKNGVAPQVEKIAIGDINRAYDRLLKVSAIRHSASTSALEPPSSVRLNSSSIAARRTAEATRENNPRGPVAASARKTDASSSSDARVTPRSRRGLRFSSEMGGAAATRLEVPQSRQLRHNDTWHGESLDRLAIPRARTDVARSSHHLSPREAPRLLLPRAAAGPGGQRTDPASCAPHHPSPRSSGRGAATRGILKSGSDPDLAARESNFAKSTTLTRVMPSAIAAAVDTRPLLQAQPQRPSNRARGPTTTLSRQIPRPAALVIDCDAGDDDDVAEPPLSAKNHHTSPASHTRQRRDRRSPAAPGASHQDQFPVGGTTVGRAQRGQCSAVAQAPSASSASPLDPASPSATSPRFPCAIPSPRLIPMAAPTAYLQSPRQQVLPSASLGGSSPAIHRQSTIATGSPAGHMERRRQEPGTERRGQRRGSNGGGSNSRQLSRFHTWDSALLDDEPAPQITPPPGPPSCREHRPWRGFSGRHHAAEQSEQPWAEGADWEERDWRGGVAGGAGGGVAQAAAAAHAASPCTGPVTRCRSHSLHLMQPSLVEHPLARHAIEEHLVAQHPIPQHLVAGHTMAEDPTARQCHAHSVGRRPVPSTLLPDCRLPRRAACDERTVRHARAVSHGGGGLGVQREGEMAGAGENMRWVEGKGGGEVQATSWKEEGELGGMEAMGGWQRGVEAADMEC